MLNNFRKVGAKIWKFQQKGYMGTSLIFKDLVKQRERFLKVPFFHLFYAAIVNKISLKRLNNIITPVDCGLVLIYSFLNYHILVYIGAILRLFSYEFKT